MRGDRVAIGDIGQMPFRAWCFGNSSFVLVSWSAWRKCYTGVDG
jgi:hypothetical protein